MTQVDSPTTASAATGIITHTSPTGVPASPRGSRRKGQWSERAKLYLVLFALMAPTLIGMAVFTYYPQYATIKYSTYRWDGGQTVEEYRGLENFRRAFTGDPLFWPTFGLVLILLAANIVKMWPSIFAAIVLHRVRSERWQYVYRVLFVLPMVIPALVGLLIWKSFYDPMIGPLNKFLNATGLIGVLAWLDTAMPALSDRLTPIIGATVDPLFHSVWGMLIVGVLLLSAQGGVRGVVRGWLWWAILLVLAFALMGGGGVVTGTAASGAIVRFLVWVGGAIAAGELLNRSFGATGRDAMRWAGGVVIGVGSLLVVLAMLWTQRTDAFQGGTPGWLSHSKLIIPSIILWGFPWIGTVGVLIYLAGLQNISQDVYEAAELDGVGSVRKLFSIELPLIMTQVRINLIFLTIGTLSDYALFMLLLGPQGGPGNVGMTPGLYMYKTAFIDGEFGYACALGIVMAAIILVITVLYQKYVKVDK